MSEMKRIQILIGEMKTRRLVFFAPVNFFTLHLQSGTPRMIIAADC